MTGIGLAQQSEKPLLRPRQVAQTKDEVARIEEMLKQPSHVLQNVDVPAAQRQCTALKQQLATQTPQPFKPDERDQAVATCADLEVDIRQGMCTIAEMRRNPAGAVDKHRAWERRKKKKILAWKNHRLRMHASGMLGDGVPEDASDIANIETLRPVGGSQEMNLDNCQITPTAYYLPPVLTSQNHASEADRKRWEETTAELLAEFAAKGEERSKIALIKLVGEDAAKAKIEAAKANVGVPAERPSKR